MNVRFAGALPPGSIGNRPVVSLIEFLLKQAEIARDVTNCRSVLRCKGLMGLLLIEAVGLERGALGAFASQRNQAQWQSWASDQPIRRSRRSLSFRNLTAQAASPPAPVCIAASTTSSKPGKRSFSSARRRAFICETPSLRVHTRPASRNTRK
jgi:hypothetical protein